MFTETRTYCPVTRDRFEEIRTELAVAGADLPDEFISTKPIDAGHGFSVEWKFQEAVFPNEPWLSITLSGPSLLKGMGWAAIESHVNAHRIS